MESSVARALLGRYKNLVFLGETGSGKTETALSLAEAAAQTEGRRVHFFDMDQTKPLFRGRDAAECLRLSGVELHYEAQYLDAPTEVSGVLSSLMDENAVTLLDVGGGDHGGRMIGQFSHVLGRENCRALYLVNPYRPWSGRGEDAAETLRRVTSQSRIGDVALSANPNLGPETTAAQVLEGLERVRALFPGQRVEFVCALERLVPELSGRVDVPILPIRLHTLPEWY